MATKCAIYFFNSISCIILSAICLLCYFLFLLRVWSFQQLECTQQLFVKRYTRGWSFVFILSNHWRLWLFKRNMTHVESKVANEIVFGYHTVAKTDLAFSRNFLQVRIRIIAFENISVEVQLYWWYLFYSQLNFVKVKDFVIEVKLGKRKWITDNKSKQFNNNSDLIKKCLWPKDLLFS